MVYDIAGTTLNIIFKETAEGVTMIPSFSLFATGRTDGEADATVVIGRFRSEAEASPADIVDTDHFRVVVGTTVSGGHAYGLTDVSGKVCCLLQCDEAHRRWKCMAVGSESQRRRYINSALMIVYACAASHNHSVLMHASVVSCGGRAYCFTAPSGTGKSTHSRLWTDNIPGCMLLNDDTPVVHADGHSVTVSGSPWSGSTPCYHNVTLPMGAVVRLEKKGYNSITPMNPCEAYTTLFPLCSVMYWDKSIVRDVAETLGHVATDIRTYRLQCLPDRGAALLCNKTIVK